MLFTRLVWIFFLAFLIGFTTSFGAKAGERENIISAIESIAPSVGALYSQEENGDIKFLCSATAVGREDDKTVILTANHCLRKGVSYLINFGDNRMRSLLVWKIPHYQVNEIKYPKVYNEPNTDMSLFLMDGTDVPIVEMETAPQTVKRGGKIITLGYPLGVTKISYEGIVAGYFDRLGSRMYNYIMLQIFGAPGSSGSAVIDVERKKIIGVLVAGKGGYSGLPVIFATPVDYIENLMEVTKRIEGEKQAPNR